MYYSEESNRQDSDLDEPWIMTVKGLHVVKTALKSLEENDNGTGPPSSGVTSPASPPASHQQHQLPASHQRMIKQNGSFERSQQQSEEQHNHKYQQHVSANNIHEKNDRVSILHHFISLLMLINIFLTCYFIFSPVHPLQYPPMTEIKNIDIEIWIGIWIVIEIEKIEIEKMINIEKKELVKRYVLIVDKFTSMILNIVKYVVIFAFRFHHWITEDIQQRLKWAQIVKQVLILPN